SDRFVYALRPSGALRWAYTDTANVNTTPALAPNGQVIVGMGSRVVAIDNLGHRVWRYVTRNSVRSSPAIASDGTIYFASDDSTLYCLNSTGTLRWAWPTGSRTRTSPAIGAAGIVYVGTAKGQLIALRDINVTAVGPGAVGQDLSLDVPSVASGAA